MTDSLPMCEWAGLISLLRPGSCRGISSIVMKDFLFIQTLILANLPRGLLSYHLLPPGRVQQQDGPDDDLVPEGNAHLLCCVWRASLLTSVLSPSAADGRRRRSPSANTGEPYLTLHPDGIPGSIFLPAYFGVLSRFTRI